MKIVVDKELIKSVVALASVIEARDPYTGGHTWRVSQYAVKLAQKAGLTKDETFVVNLGALVHDLGKIGIGDAILLKPDKLTEEEYDIMKQHPNIGNDLISAHPLFAMLVDSVFTHHERVDGSGYPNHVGGKALSRIGRITAIADAFDAMTSTRPYRKGMPLEKVVSIMESEKGKQFDSELMDCFLKLIKTGDLNPILGHGGEEKLILSCSFCGPIITPENRHRDGHSIICPSCHGSFVMHQSGDTFELEFSGNTKNIVVPKVDHDTVNEFLKKVPIEISFGE